MLKKIIIAVVALVALGTIFGGEDTEPVSKAAQPAPTASSEPAEPTATPSEEPTLEYTTPEPRPTADPDGTYESSCDYVLGDFSENPRTGYRFVADVSMKNTGNIGLVNRVKATWYLSGGGKVVETKEVKVKAGRSKRVGITVPITNDQLDLHQSLGYNTETCRVRVAMIDTFGSPR